MKTPLSDYDRGYITGYATALQNIMFKLTGENSCGKSYDPCTIYPGDVELHSYAFDLRDGGRHHSLSDYNGVDDITDLMLDEAVAWIRG